MLVLSRFPGQRLIIQTAAGERIEIKVVEVQSGKRVRLGLTADKSVQIDREEIAVAKERDGAR